MIQYNKGDKFGELTFIEEDFHEKEVTGYQTYRKAVMLCFCGRKFITRITGLLNGNCKSCGCLQKHKLRIQSMRHNMSSSPEYTSWEAMKERCSNPNKKQYKDYGGRGIKVCDEWLDFRNFYKDMGNKPDKKYSIERINNDGNYESSNCRWASKYDQERNKTTNVWFNYKGRDMIITDISRETGVHSQTIRARTSTGMTIEEAVNKKYKFVKSGKYSKK